MPNPGSHLGGGYTPPLNEIKATTVGRRIDHTAPCGLNVSRQSSNTWPPRGLNTSSRSIAIIHAWGYGVGFDTLHFFGRSGGTSLGAPCVFHPTPMEVPGTLAHRRSGWWPWQGHLLGMRPSPLKPWGGVGLPVTFTSQQYSAGVKGSPWIPVGSGGSPTTFSWVPPLWGLFGSPVLYDRGSEITGSPAVNSNILVPRQATDVFPDPRAHSRGAWGPGRA